MNTPLLPLGPAPAAAVLFALFTWLPSGQAAEPDSPAPAAPAAAVDAAPAAVERGIRFQFDGMPYSEALERFAQMVNKPLLLETNIDGAITFSDSEPYTYAEALDTLNLILSMKQVMLVESDRYLRLVPLSKLPQMPLKIFRGLNQIGDARPGEIVTVVLELKNLDAGEVAAATRPMLSSAGSIAPLSRGRGLVITDSLGTIQRVRKLLDELDSETHVQRQMKTFTLLHASGAVVSDLINRTFGVATAPKRLVFNEQRKTYDELTPDPNDYVTAVFDEASRTLLLFGPRDRVVLAEELISKFEDKEGGRAGEVRIYYPETTSPSQLAQMIREAVPAVAGPNETAAAAATKARLIIDSSLNRLIVAAPIAGQLDAIEQFIRKVDADASAASESEADVRVTRVFRPKRVDPSTAAQVVTNALARRTAAGNWRSTVAVTLDPATQSLVVTGSSSDIQQADQILSQLDSTTTSSVPRALTIHPLKHTTIDRIFSQLTNLVGEKLSDRRFLDDSKPLLTADPANNRLLLTATEEQKAVVDEIVLALDVPIEAPRRSLTMIPVQSKPAAEIIALVNQLLPPPGQTATPAGQEPKLMADTSGQQIVVLAVPNDLERIQALVQQLDGAATPPRDRHLEAVPLYGRNVSDFTPLVEQLYKEQIKGLPPSPGGPATLLPEPRENRIMISGPASEIARIKEIIRQLDPADPADGREETRVVRLQMAVATDLVDLIEKSLNARKQQVKVLVDARSNSLVLSGSQAAVEAAIVFVRQLDAKPPLQPRELRILDLKSSEASQLAPLVSNLFTQIVREDHGPNYVSPTSITPDAASNRLILTGPQDELAQVAVLVDQLDQAPVQAGGSRVFKLKHASASTLAPLVTSAMTKFDPQGRPIQQAAVVAEEKSNSLVVTGSRAELQDAAVVIETLDVESTDGHREFRIIPITSEDPAMLADLVGRVFHSQSRGRPGRDDVTFNTDATGKRLIVLGPPNLMPLIESLVTALDQTPGGASRDLHFVEVSDTGASELLPLVQRIYAEQGQGQPGKAATIMLDPSGTRLAVLGTSDQAEAIQRIATTLDSNQPSPGRQTQFFDLGQSADALRLLPLIQQLYQDQIKNRAAQGPADAQFLNDTKTGRLIVSARTNHLSLIESIVQQVQSGYDQTDTRQTRLFAVGQPGEVERLVTLVQQLYQDQWKDRVEEDPADAKILADPRAGRIIVTGRAHHIEAIAALMDDVGGGDTPVEPLDTRVYELKNAAAAELASTLRALYSEQLKTRTDAPAIQTLILPDEAANRLILAGASNELDRVEELVQKLDQTTRQTADTRVFALRHAKAEQIAAVLSTAMVRVSTFGRTVPRVSVGADPQSNTLIVTGDPKDLQATSVIVEQLDVQPARAPRRMHIVPLRSGLASELAAKVQQLYNEELKSRPERERDPALIMGDDASNRLIISAPEEDITLIQDIVAKLDGAPETTGRQIRVVTLENNSATAVQTILAQLYSKQIASPDPAQRLVLSASPDDRNLVIDANPLAFGQIEKLIQNLEQPAKDNKTVIQTVHLKKGQADSLAQAISSTLASRGRATPASLVVVTPVPDSNSLLLRGPEEAIREVTDLIQELDQESQGGGVELRLYRIQNGSPREIGTTIEDLLRSSEIARARRGGLAQGARPEVEFDEANKTIFVLGNSHHFHLVEQLLPELDKLPDKPSRDIQVVWLKNAKAADIAPKIESLFADRPRADRPVIEYDASANSITLIGRRTDLMETEGLIRRFDEAALDDSIQVRLVPIDRIPVEQIAHTLEKLYPQMHHGRLRIVDQIQPPPESPAPRTSPPDSEPAPPQNPPPAGLDAAPAAQEPPDRQPEVVVSIDKEANTLLISGPGRELDRVEDLILELTFSFISSDAEFRQFVLQEADPVNVAKTLTDLFKLEPVTVREGQQSRQVPQPPKITVVPDSRSRSVIVRADPTEFPLLESLIKQMDSPGLKPELDFRLVALTNAQPEKLLPLLNQTITQLRSIRPGEAISVSVEPRSRGLLLVARDTTLNELEKLVRELDSPSPYAESEVQVVTLRKVNAAQIVGILQNLLRPDAQGALTTEARELQEQVQRLKIVNPAGEPVRLDLTKPIKILADPLQAGQNGGNRLLISSTPDNLAALTAVIHMMDNLPLTEGVDVKILPLHHADAAAVAATLTTIFTQGKTLATGPTGPSQPDSATGQALTNPLVVTVDQRSNTLLLSGHKSAIDLAVRIVDDLDRELGRFVTDVRLFTLRYASATRMAPLLQAVFAESSASPATEGLATHITRLRTVLAGGVAKTSELPKGRPPLVVQADDPSNTLIVAARSDLIPLVEDVILKLDTPDAASLDNVRIYPLKNARASQVLQVITDLFSRARGSRLRPEDRPTVTADERTNSLIVSGDEQTFAFIDSLVAQLDTGEAAERTTFQVFPLQNATASKLQSTLQSLLANRVSRQRGQPPEPVTVLADAPNNALIVSASGEDMLMVASLIQKLDSARGEAAAEIEIFPLSKADARRIAETVQNLYRGGTAGAAGTSPGAVNISVDDRINAIIVSGGDADRKRIAELVRKLDTDQVGRVSEIRVIPLQYARAQSLATILNNALNQQPAAAAAGDPSPNTQSLLQFITRTEAGEELITSALRERVLITPDPRMNSLIVSAPLDYMPLLDQVIHRLDAHSPQLAQIKVFTLKNADARQMANVLTALFRLQIVPGLGGNAGERSIQYTLVRPKLEDPTEPETVEPGAEGASATLGTAEENALTVTIDPRTNSLLVGGTDHYVALASEIIESLDSSPVQDRQTEVYRLRNSQAPEVEQALRTFLDQDRQRVIQALGPDAVGAAERLLEREVAIVAESTSNALLMSANPRYFEEIKALIEQLDQPQPQVLIQALIAEVLLDSSTELGVEWAYTGSSGSKTYDIGTSLGVEEALRSFGGFSAAITGSDYTFLLRALQNDGRLQILSRPQILTADNQPATINVGQRVPLIINSRITDNGNTINSFEYQTVGVILTVTPRISPDGFVRMDVGTTNSALSSSSVDISEGVQAPVINERLATTTVSVRSGQSIIIGGLISTTDDDRTKRVPVLGDIPLLGMLFRSSTTLKDRKELLIFLTPQVLVKLENEEGIMVPPILKAMPAPP